MVGFVIPASDISSVGISGERAKIAFGMPSSKVE
jgi:hypothetical protein